MPGLGLPFSTTNSNPSNSTITELENRLNSCTDDSRRALLRYMIEREKLEELRRSRVEAEQRLNLYLEGLRRMTSITLFGWQDSYDFGVLVTTYGHRLPNLKADISTSLPPALRNEIYAHAVRQGYAHFINQPY